MILAPWLAVGFLALSIVPMTIFLDTVELPERQKIIDENCGDTPLEDCGLIIEPSFISFLIPLCFALVGLTLGTFLDFRMDRECF
jgi:hypothetical protein